MGSIKIHKPKPIRLAGKLAFSAHSESKSWLLFDASGWKTQVGLEK
jgi:hypothetical protein